MWNGETKEMEFRLGKLTDLDEICELVKLAIKNMDGQGILQWDELYPMREDFEEDVKKQELYICILDKKIVAIYVLNQECDEDYASGRWKYPDASYIVLHRLCVNPSVQNQGIATKVIRHIFAQVNEMKIESIRLDAFSSNPYALRMYDKLGFEIVGEVEFRKGRFYLMEKKI